MKTGDEERRAALYPPSVQQVQFGIWVCLILNQHRDCLFIVRKYCIMKRCSAKLAVSATPCTYIGSVCQEKLCHLRVRCSRMQWRFAVRVSHVHAGFAA